MESFLSKTTLSDLERMVSVGLSDKQAELEMKVLAGEIQTKDVADRMVKTIEEITAGGFTEEHRATFSYQDGLRVSVTGPENIHKLCMTNSFRNLPVTVERKTRYFERGADGVVGPRVDVLDISDFKLRVTLRREEPLRRDFTGAPLDPSAHVRIMHRKSWNTADGVLRIDMSQVKSRQKQHKTFADILGQTPSFELELEVVKKDAENKTILKSLFQHVEPLLAAFQQSPFLLSQSDLRRYEMEFGSMKMVFINPVTLERRHLRGDRPHNILSGYTVTNKADGERSFLVVMRDRRLLKVTPSGKITWTGMTATKDTHIGDVVDGEYLADRNLFCIFDMYAFHGKKIMNLPLMTTDEDVLKNPLKSRLGCARQFTSELLTDFKVLTSQIPMRVENKLFLAGDGGSMEQAIRKLLDIKFEYPTDGLIFTPRSSPVAPIGERQGRTWTSVYKWKPANQNSIDFLVRFNKNDVSYDPVLKQQVIKGTLYVSRNPGTDIVYPCETITGEYVPPQIPDDMRIVAEDQDLVPSPFQPSAPRAPDAMNILIPVNARNVPVDEEGQRIEDNTIIECSRDVDHRRWNVMRTRYDKTYQYRVLRKPNYGNYIDVADNIWTNIHVPITDAMIRNVVSNPPDDTFEDDLYYRDALEAKDRVLKDVYSFHNEIKESLYRSSIKTGDTLLELAVGRAGDLHKWRKTRPSKVVGIDLFEANLTSPRQGACARYLRELKKKSAGKLPPVLFVQGDMTKPLYEQESPYFKILSGEQPAPTEYLEKFHGLRDYDAISCQFAIHYACESEEMFHTFAQNLEDRGKGLFFGTCMDGREVYSLLLGKPNHTFRVNTQVYGEFTKQYDDGAGWTEEFGKAIDVKLESFEQSMREYLVPFERVCEILAEHGYELVVTTLFADHYAQQNAYTFTREHQDFSFLHRSFVFRRGEKPKKKKEETQAVEVPVFEEKKEDAKAEKKTIKIKKEEKQEEKPKEEPVFFFSGNPLLNEFREFSNMHDAPFQVDGVTYPTVEHYFQWMKAKTFGDVEMETKIMKTKSAKSVKTYGKKVKDFKDEEWAGKKDEIMKTAVRAKFIQHPDLRTKLLDTNDRIIGEADPRDKYWGIGTSAGTSKAMKPEQWPGKNVLGKILMEVRSSLRDDAV